MKNFLVVIEVKVEGADGIEVQEDVEAALYTVDTEKAIADELAQHLMVPDDDVRVTIHEVAPTQRFSVPRTKKVARSRT